LFGRRGHEPLRRVKETSSLSLMVGRRRKDDQIEGDPKEHASREEQAGSNHLRGGKIWKLLKEDGVSFLEQQEDNSKQSSRGGEGDLKKGKRKKKEIFGQNLAKKVGSHMLSRGL